MESLLDKYIRVRLAMRESDEAILKENDLNWTAWKKLCSTVEAVFPSEGLVKDKYRFVVESQPKHLIPASAPVIDVVKRVSIHSTK